MASILIATIGSLGDMHPKIALGLELKNRGHEVRFAAMEFYREKLELLGFDFRPMAPHLDPYDTEFARELMDERQGSERIIREVIFPSLPEMYSDLIAAAEGADAFITGELIYAADAVAVTSTSKWISTSLAPISLFSIYDPPVPPVARWLENLRFLGPTFHSAVFALARMSVSSWFAPYKKFRRGLGLSEDHDPVFPR